MNEWANTTRYVYNKCLGYIKEHGVDVPEAYMVKTFITRLGKILIEDNKKNIDNEKFMYKWELNTPKDIRKGAYRDIQKAFKTAFSQLKKGQLRHFNMDFRKKKTGDEQSLEIPGSAIEVKYNKKNAVGITIYTSYMDEPIKIYKPSKYKKYNFNNISYCRLKKEKGEWYLCFPYSKKEKKREKTNRTCALDPGIRAFQTIYSEDAIFQVKANNDKIEKLFYKMDNLTSLRDDKVIKRKSFNKGYQRIQRKIKNMVDDMHFKTIRFLINNYDSILLPSFESQDMIGGNIPKITKRFMNTFSFYKFRQRLEHAVKLLENVNLTIVNEAYTTRTCGECGFLNPKTSNEYIKCKKCNIKYNRDVNGSRNIYIKYVC
jgi:putative transposase